MRYLPDGPEIDGRPHVRLGLPAAGGPTPALCLWNGPEADIPAGLGAATLTGIALNLLRSPEGRARLDGLETATTDAFDGDRLLALWALTDPDAALARAERTLDAASAAAFGISHTDELTQIACLFRGYAEEAGIEDPAGIYRDLLPRVSELLDSPRSLDLYWIGEYSDVLRADHLLNSGAVQIEDVPELDLTVMETPLRLHDVVRLTAAPSLRLLTVRSENTYIVEYRRESWVRFPPRPVRPRIDLRPLASRLNLFERARGSWRAEPVSDPTPRLFLDDGRGRPAPSTIDAQTVIAEVKEFLRDAERRPELHWLPGREGRS